MGCQGEVGVACSMAAAGLAAARQIGGVDRLDRAHRVALDTRDLDQPADRIAGQAEQEARLDLGGGDGLSGRGRRRLLDGGGGAGGGAGIGGVDRLDRAHRVALDTRDLDQPADRIAGQAEIICC
jgi:CubicO group peptidase (beta-lactamase class C family)